MWKACGCQAWTCANAPPRCERLRTATLAPGARSWLAANPARETGPEPPPVKRNADVSDCHIRDGRRGERPDETSGHGGRPTPARVCRKENTTCNQVEILFSDGCSQPPLRVWGWPRFFWSPCLPLFGTLCSRSGGRGDRPAPQRSRRGAERSAAERVPRDGTASGAGRGSIRRFYGRTGGLSYKSAKHVSALLCIFVLLRRTTIHPQVRNVCLY